MLRRGRSMSQLTATVRTPAADVGLTAIAVYGAERRGASFVDIAPPEVPVPTASGRSDELPEGVDFTFDRAPMPFRNTSRVPPGGGSRAMEPFVEGPSDVVYRYRLDDPPVLADGTLTGRRSSCSATPCRARSARWSARSWARGSAQRRLHLPPAGLRPTRLAARPLARTSRRRRLRLIEMTLWDPDGWTPVVYGTQVMFFAFGR